VGQGDRPPAELKPFACLAAGMANILKSESETRSDSSGTGPAGGHINRVKLIKRHPAEKPRSAEPVGYCRRELGFQSTCLVPVTWGARLSETNSGLAAPVAALTRAVAAP
jgi:hypothetical protein